MRSNSISELISSLVKFHRGNISGIEKNTPTHKVYCAAAQNIW
jgi:hypothetical protein